MVTTILKSMAKSVLLIIIGYLGYGMLGLLCSLALFSSLHPEFYLYTFALLAKKESLTITSLLLAFLYLVGFIVFVFGFPLMWAILGGKRATQIALARFFLQTGVISKIIERLDLVSNLNKGEGYLQRVEERFSQAFRQVIWNSGEPKGLIGKIFADLLESNLRTIFLKELRESWQTNNQGDLHPKVVSSLIRIFQPSWDYFFLLLSAQLFIYLVLLFTYKF